MKIAVPKEVVEGERRVAFTPDTVSIWKKEGVDIFIQAGAGKDSYFEDIEYKHVGAEIVSDKVSLFKDADIVLKVQSPILNEVDLIKKDAILVCLLQPLYNLALVGKIADRFITAFSMDSIPRITRAQSMDALSSQALISGYKAVLFGANTLPKFFPMAMTAAMTIRPAKVLIIGAGVSGLQAISTARRLGAVVKAIDTRPQVKDEVQSLGASFIVLDVKHEEAQDSGGYAKAQSEDFYKKEQEIIFEHLKDADVVVTTAQIPGKKAPILITGDMTKEMKKGSVIIDLAIETGGNCTLSERGKIVNKDGIIVYGFENAPSSMPFHASSMYAKNISAFIKEFIKNGSVSLDFENEIIKGTAITHKGEVVHPRVKDAISKKGGS